MPSKSSQRKKRKRFQQGRRTPSGVLGHEAVIEGFVALQRFFESTLEEGAAAGLYDHRQWSGRGWETGRGSGLVPDSKERGWAEDHLKRLKHAQVYTVDPALYTHLHEEAHELVMREIGMTAAIADELCEDTAKEAVGHGLDDLGEWMEEAASPAAESMRLYGNAFGEEVERRRVAVEGFNVDHLPFRHTYFGYDDGILLDPLGLEHRFGNLDLPDLQRVWVLGHLFSADGTVVEFFRTGIEMKGRKPRYGFGYGTLREPDGWNCGNSLMPVILTTLLETVHGLHTTFVTQVPVPKAHRKGLKRVAQEVIPEEFYLVRIRPKHITINQRTKEGDEETPKRKLTYRRDRAGHVRCLFQTDKLPLDPALKRSLVERGYSVYEDYRPVAPQHMAYAIERGKPLRQPGYWWAILVTHVQEHQFPSDPSLPYRPANRLVQ